jgi:hypothetical protein
LFLQLECRSRAAAEARRYISSSGVTEDLMEDLIYTFTTTAAPVQAEGTICGKPFYFRARHSSWSFAVAKKPNLDPKALVLPARGSSEVFLIEGKFGKASYMSLSKARKLIESCAEAYLHDQGKSEI